MKIPLASKITMLSLFMAHFSCRVAWTDPIACSNPSPIGRSPLEVVLIQWFGQAREYRAAANMKLVCRPPRATRTYALPRHDAFGAPLTIASSNVQMQNADCERNGLDDWSRGGARDGSLGR
jgi:hypothetical protein